MVEHFLHGYGIKPTYREIIKIKNRFKENNFAEVVEVTFNNEVITLRSLLEHFYESHDPTQLNKQGNDIGTQYRSTILYTNPAQKELIEEVTDEFQQLLYENGYGEIQTLIKPLNDFYKADEYHQDYIKKNPNGYCPDHSTGVVFNTIKKKKDIDNSLLLEGKFILVIDSQDYCPYCEKFNQDVANDYKGSIPLVYRTAIELDGLEIKTNGLTEVGSACYGSGDSLKIRVSVAILPGHEYLVREKLHLRDLLKSFCETEELYKLARRIPIVWPYSTIKGQFYR